MAIFKPIASETDLPAPHTSREQLALDFKETQSRPFDYFEMAKDVAAFANAGGGVVLVGAQEDQGRSRLGRYTQLPERDAKHIKEAFEDATKRRCYPKPLIDPVILPRDGGFVVAVNVWPFPGHFVGVEILGDATDGYGDPAYVFPVRVGTHCQYLAPDQIAMLMLPKHRHVSILLDRIPPDAKVTITGSNLLDTEVVMSEVHSLENVLVVEGPEKPWKLNVPIDAVRSVWNDTTVGWRVIIDGWLYVPSDDTVPSYKPVKTQG
tara:strand:- start:3577 stop:4368 length:792 start_codon:yes stop_codon:yes gene_type:complete